MRHAVATWPFMEPGVSLARRIEQFADMGFDGLSFLPRQVLEPDEAEARDLIALLRERSLVATVHGDFHVTPAEVERVLERLGPALKCLTFDAATTWHALGRFYDAPRMARLLAHVERCSRGSELRFAVEDFPLNAAALDHYRDGLGDALDSPRFGVLIDVGHMNLRIGEGAYFAGLTVEQYLTGVPLPIVEVHLHDNAGGRDSHGPFGSGNIRFEEVAAGLRAARFEGVSTIEIAPSLHGGSPADVLPRIPESLAAWRELWGQSAAG
jgi:sugar phosphate isomerase/epimerase